ncbi:MAG: methylmalonyl-CoA mutase family protein, partial [Dehalococcoidales bacterium]|nr:methylmalonyl-CoA mutase family protein [Dehalococcoidales bacterium]
SAPPGSTHLPGSGHLMSGAGLVRAGQYSGYGTAEDTRDYYKNEIARGRRQGPNQAFDLPTQIGYDSDDSLVQGEVGKVGVAVDSLRDMEIIYEAFVGDMDLDKIASNWTINGPVNVILAMYIALAEKRGIPQGKLRGTPQNDILKEFIARGTYIFPVKPSMRMVRDTIVYCSENMPLMNTVSICGNHMREQGATGVQTLAFTLCNLIAYIQIGIDAGLDVDEFVPRFSANHLSGSMDFFQEIALQRATRRLWARTIKERFGAKNPRTCLYRPSQWARQGDYSCTVPRPLNNFTRAVIGGIAGALSGGNPGVVPPYDEPLGLGWSREALQLNEDARRIIQYEAKLCDVTDPLAGSYYVESLTDKIEHEAEELIKKVDGMGGVVPAIENGFVQQEIARSAYEYQRQVESGERIIVGVNAFTGEQELEVLTNRLVPYPYDAEKRARAEERQIASLSEVKRNRNNQAVQQALGRIKEAAQDEKANLIPVFVEAVKEYATLGEICGVLRAVFGEYQFRD